MDLRAAPGTAHPRSERAPSPRAGSRWRARRLDIGLATVVVSSAIVFYWLATHGTWRPGYRPVGYFDGGTDHFFLAQAHALALGRLFVPASALGGDCFVRSGHCFGYFGLTPSLLRLPFLGLLDHYRNGFTPVFLTAALTVATAGSVAALREVVRQVRLRAGSTLLIVLAATSLGGAGVLSQLAFVNVYDEAIAWAAAFMSLAVFAFMRWWARPGTGWLVALGASLVLATNSRPTAVPFAVVVACGVLWRLWSDSGARHGASRPAAVGLAACALIVLPVATCLGVFEAKLGTLVPNYLHDQLVAGPFAEGRWIAVRAVDHNNLTSARYVPTSLLAYLRPDAVHFTGAFPWLDFRFASRKLPSGLAGPVITYLGIPSGSLYTATVASLTDVMPLCVVLVLEWLAGFAAKRRTVAVLGFPASSPSGLSDGSAVPQLERSPLGARRLWAWTLVVAGIGAWSIVLPGVAIANRFLGDAFPLCAVILVVRLPMVATRIDAGSPWLRRAAAGVLGLVLAWQVLANLALAWRYPGA